MLTPPRHEATALLVDPRAECGARRGEATPDPRRVVAVREPRVRELEPQRDRLEQGVRTEVQGVIVGKRHAVDAEVLEYLCRPRRRAEVEDTSRRRLAARGDAALEVEDEQVRLTQDLHHLRREERLRRVVLEP